MRIVCPILFLRLSVLVDLPDFIDIPTPFPELEALDGGNIVFLFTEYLTKNEPDFTFVHNSMLN